MDLTTGQRELAAQLLVLPGPAAVPQVWAFPRLQPGPPVAVLGHLVLPSSCGPRAMQGSLFLL